MRRTRPSAVAPHALIFILLINIGAVAAFRWQGAQERLREQPAPACRDARTAVPVKGRSSLRTESAAKSARACREVADAR